MANVVVTPNMSLPTPTPGQETGPQYASDNNSCFNILDGHNHSPGSGVQITPLGLDINVNLNIQNNDLTNVSGVDFSIPATSTEVTRVYTAPQSGGGITDLFYNDGAGNVIPLTKAGVVNATAASIPGESYSGGTFTWVQGTGSTTPANFDIGSVTVRPNTAMTTNGVTLEPASAIASEYSLVLPLLPGATSLMQLDSSGNITATLVPDNSTIVIASNILGVPTGGITDTQIATATITSDKLASALLQLLAPSGSMVAYGGTSAPSGYLMCDGTSYLRTTYPNLFTAIGVAYGTADGTHFNVPDLRGIFPRGTDNGAGNDPDTSSRTAANAGGNTGDNVGSTQASAFATHVHQEQGLNGGTSGNPGLRTPAQNGISNTGPSSGTIDNTGSAGSSTETRPINTYVNYIIKT